MALVSNLEFTRINTSFLSVKITMHKEWQWAIYKLTFELILLGWVGNASLAEADLGFRTSSSMHTPCVDPKILSKFER